MAGKAKTTKKPTMSRKHRQNQKNRRTHDNERDGRIAHLEKLQHSTQEAFLRAQAELLKMRSIRKTDMMLQDQQMSALEREKDAMREEIAQLRKEMNAEALLAEYAAAMKKPEACRESSLEALLCKAIHSVESLSSQLDAAKKSHDAIMRLREDDIAKIVSESRKSEAKLVDQIVALAQNEKTKLEDQYREDIGRKNTSIDISDLTIEDMRDERTTCDIWRQRSASDGDLAIALKATKYQLDSVAQQKEALSNDLCHELQNRDGTIASLEDTIAARERLIVQTRNQTGDMLGILDEIVLMTSAVENSITNSLMRKRKLLESLENDPSCATTATAAYDGVEAVEAAAKASNSFHLVRHWSSTSRMPSRRSISRDGCGPLAEC